MLAVVVQGVCTYSPTVQVLLAVRVASSTLQRTVCRPTPPPGIFNLSSGAGRVRSHKPDSYAIQLQSPTLQSIGPPSIKNIPRPG